MSGVFEEPKGKILPGKKATSILIDRQKINRIAESHDLHDFDTFQNKVLPDLGDLFDFQAASFHLFDPLHATLNAEGNFIKAAFQNTTLKTFKFEDIAFCDSPLETIRKLSEPTFFDTNYWINEYPEYLRSGLLTNVYKYQCIIPLLYRQEIFGVLIFYSGIQGFCEDLNPELLQCLTGQFSLTLQLLLSEQKIAEAALFKNGILETSNAILAVENRDDLLTVFLSNIRKVIPFDGFVIALPGNDGQSAKIFLKYLNPEIKSMRSETRPLPEWYAPEDGITDLTLLSDQPVLINFQKIKRDRNIPEYLSSMKNANIKSSVGVALKMAGKPIASLMFFAVQEHVYRPERLQFIQDIAEQLSLTVTENLADESVEDRNDEKEILFSLITHIATVRDKNDLLKAIDHHLKSLFPVSDVAIRLYDDENKTHSVYLVVAGEVRKNHPDFKKMVNVETTIYDGVFDRILMSDRPVLLDVEKEIKGGLAPAYTKFLMATGIRETLNVVLRNGDEKIGTFVLYAEKKGAFKAKHFELIEAVGLQVSVAVANIHANKNILNREREKSFLLDLSNSVVNVREKDELMTLLYERVKTIIPITDAGISLISDDKKWKCAYLFIPGQERLNHPDCAVAANKNYNIKRGIYYKILTAKEPLIYDPRELRDEDPDDSPMKFLADSGIKQCMSVILRDGDVDIGFMCLFSEQADAFKRSQVSFVKAIGYQIAGSLANILANGRAAAEEHEKSILLSLSDKIANIRDKDDLLRVISAKFRELFDFSDIIISAISPDKTYKSVYLMDTRAEKRDHPLFNEFYYAKIDITSGLFKQVLDSNEPLIFNIEDDSGAKASAIPNRFLLETGVKQGIAVALKDGSDVIGFMSIFSDHGDTFLKEQSGLIQGMANQIAGAFANVLANTEIIRRENEKSQLLAFSNELATVKTKQELSAMITRKLHELIGGLDFNLVIVSDDKTTARNYLFNPVWYKSVPREMEEALHRPYQVPDGLFERVISSEDFIELDVVQLNGPGEVPAYVRVWNACNFKTAFGVPIRLGNNEAGVIWFCSKEKGNLSASQYRLFKGISAQISVAVANIAANEEIIDREKEKSILLSFSHDISTIRNRNALSDIINRYLTDLFMVEDYLLSIKNEDNLTHSYFIYNLKPDISENDGFKRIKNNKFKIKGGMAEIVFKSDLPVEFNLETLIREGTISFPDAAYWISAGFNNLTALPLKVGDREVGIMWTRAKRTQNNLLRGVTAQMAIAIANTLANEEIVARETEKSTLLSLSNDINAIRNRDELFQVIYHKAEALFSSKNIVITTLNEDRKTHKVIPNNSPDWFFANGGEKIAEASFKSSDVMYDQVLNSKHPITFNIKELSAQSTAFEYIQCLEQQGMTEVVGMPLRVGNEILGCFWICYLEGTSMAAEKFRLLKSVCAQLSVAISNISAFEKIKNQLVEIKQYKQLLQEEKQYLQEEIRTSSNFSEIVGAGDEMRKVFRLVSQVSASDSSVLLLGETGTGKELIARAIHDSSNRKEKLMVKVNCATLPASLIESELFGHEKGSFTGATDRRIGKFELANLGTLFLDEIGELPLELQSKLLRALQEKEIERVGGRTVIKIDVRIIAATNRNLYKEVKAGNFRSDLFFRLDVFPIVLPALRQRAEDISLLANHFVIKHARRSGRKVTGLSAESMQSLLTYSWPGNVRELEHWIERSVLLASGPVITAILSPLEENSNIQTDPAATGILSIDEIERQHIIMVLKKCSGRVAGPGGAAEVLFIPSTTLNSKIKRLGIRKEQFT